MNKVVPVTVVTPAKVDNPDTFSCCDVKLVVVVTPNVETPVTCKF